MGLDDPLQALLEFSPWPVPVLWKGSFLPFPNIFPPLALIFPCYVRKNKQTNKKPWKYQLRLCAVTWGNTFISFPAASGSVQRPEHPSQVGLTHCEEILVHGSQLCNSSLEQHRSGRHLMHFYFLSCCLMPSLPRRTRTSFALSSGLLCLSINILSGTNTPVRSCPLESCIP